MAAESGSSSACLVADDDDNYYYYFKGQQTVCLNVSGHVADGYEQRHTKQGIFLDPIVSSSCVNVGPTNERNSCFILDGRPDNE